MQYFFWHPITRGGLRASPSIQAAARVSKPLDRTGLRRAARRIDRFAAGHAAASSTLTPSSLVRAQAHSAGLSIPRTILTVESVLELGTTLTVRPLTPKSSRRTPPTSCRKRRDIPCLFADDRCVEKVLMSQMTLLMSLVTISSGRCDG